jgi:hypothetical protein
MDEGERMVQCFRGGFNGSRLPLIGIHSIATPDNPLDPNPPNNTSNTIVRKVPPRERGANQGPAQKMRSNFFQNRRMPDLKYFQGTGDEEYPDRNSFCGLFKWKKEKNEQDPEDDIEHPDTVLVEPPLKGSRIKLENKPCGGDKKQGKENIFAGLTPVYLFSPSKPVNI